MFENFFISGDLPSTIEVGTYTPLLVVASYVVAAFGAYSSLILLPHIVSAATAREKNLLRIISAFALGSGIWSMHFIGMLAYRMRMEIHYNPWLTGLSMGIAVALAYGFLFITSAKTLSAPRLIGGALLLGLSVSAMHYTGMAAMEMGAQLRYEPLYFFLSLAVSVAASGAALGVLFYFERSGEAGQNAKKALAALVMGVAVCGMHYTGMRAAVFIPFADCRFDSNQNFMGLAALVLIVTCLIFAIAFLYVSSRRLLLIICTSTLFALPLVTIVYEAISELNAQILFSEKERDGMQYHTRLVDVLQRLQELRGLTYRQLNGEAAVATERLAKKQEVTGMIASMDALDASLGIKLAVHEKWLALRARTLSMLEDPSSRSPAEVFEHDSQITEAVHDLMVDVSDNSNLTLDPQQDTDYLADAIINVTPDIIETLGKLRGLTTGLLAAGKMPPQWTPQELRRLQMLYDQLDLHDEDMRNSLERAGYTNKQSAIFVADHDKNVSPKLQEFKTHLQRMIFDRAPDVSGPALSMLATDTIAAYDALYDTVSDAFLSLIKEREDGYVFKRNLVFYSSMAAGLGFLLLFVFLYRSLARTERAEKDALAASHTKSEFLANMSHELRTPLNSILGMTRMLSESDLPQEQHELADTVFRSSVNLLEIVNDILDLSKIEAGELTLEHIGFDLGYVFHSVVHALDHIAKEKRLPLIRNYEKENFPYLIGDPTRLNNILTNLIGNAIKYTDKGQVEIFATCTRIDDSRVSLRCEVKDTGIGIAESKRQSVFEKFIQADTSTTRKYGGTGLGLAITKHLVELMGGTIGVQSEEGKGSTFWFAIPFEITNTLTEDKYIRRQKMNSGTIAPENARILLAEDHPMNQLFMKKIFKKFGMVNVQIVENGVLALAAYREKPWDVILMDCHMPEKNGYETTLEIRQLEKTTGVHVPIVAMTANAMVGDKEKCLRYGMDEYLSKPVNIDALRDVLSQWLLFPDTDEADGAVREAAAPAPLDMAQLRSFSEGDKEAEKELIAAFVQQSDKNVKTLEETRAGGDSRKWMEAAHMFKGGAVGIGATILGQLCQEGQHFSGTDAERAALFEKISREYARLKAYLKESGLLG